MLISTLMVAMEMSRAQDAPILCRQFCAAGTAYGA